MGQALELVYDFIVDHSLAVERIKKERPIWLALIVTILAVITHSISLGLMFTDWSAFLLQFVLPGRIIITVCVWVVIAGLLHFTAELLHNNQQQVMAVSPQPAVDGSAGETVVLEHGLAQPKTESVKQPPEGKMVDLFNYLAFGLFPLFLILPLTLLIKLSPWGRGLLFISFSWIIIFWILYLQTVGIRKIYGVTTGRAIWILSLPFIGILVLFLVIIFTIIFGVISLIGSILW